MRRFVPRPALALLLALVASGAAAGSLAAKATPLRITAPGRALQGKIVAISVKSQSFTCKLSVRFANGDKQSNMPPTQVQSGKVVWQWQVPQFAPAGQAKLTVACPGAAKATRSIIVVGGLIPPRVVVVKKGYSSRVQGTSENVSYGIVLQNTSPNGNALSVQVLVNFVLPDNHLIGTASANIPIINAGSQYNLGGQIGFGGAPTITRLEIVINPGGSAKSAKTSRLRSTTCTSFQLRRRLAGLGRGRPDQRPSEPDARQLEHVLRDPGRGGQRHRGRHGAGSFKLLPGTRSFFKIAGGLDPIPFNKAASAAISIIPQYESAAP
jgi:hypothetical protein